MNKKRVIFQSLFFIVFVLLGFLLKPIIKLCEEHEEETIEEIDSPIIPDSKLNPEPVSPGPKPVASDLEQRTDSDEQEKVIYILSVDGLTQKNGRYNFKVHVNSQQPDVAEFKLYLNSLNSTPIQKNLTGEFNNILPLPDSVSVYLVTLSVADSLLAMIEIAECVPLEKPEKKEIKEKMSYAQIERAINNGDINNRNLKGVKFKYTNLREGEVAQNSIANIYTMLECQMWEKVKCVAATYREDNSLESITLEIVYADENP